jgi:hypothetical protein
MATKKGKVAKARSVVKRRNARTKTANRRTLARARRK